MSNQSLPNSNKEKPILLKIKSWVFLPLLLLLLTFSSVNFSHATSLRFYVDCPFGAPNFPLTPGHAFVQFIPMNNDQTGDPNLVYGFYPAGLNLFGGPGVIRNDSQRNWDFSITYNVTPAQYNAAAAKVNAAIAAPPAYHLLNFNCVDWVCCVAAAAGLALPAAVNRIGAKDPNVLWISLNNIGAGGTFGDGTAAQNVNSVAPNGGPLETNSPKDCSYESAENLGHTDPDSLADSKGLPKDFYNLGPFTLDRNDTLTIFVTGPDPANALVSMNWDDGSVFDAQELVYQHLFPGVGQYTIDLVVLAQGVVHSITMSYNVQDSVTSQNFQEIILNQFPADTFANPMFGDPLNIVESETPNAIDDPALAGLDIYPIPASDRLRITLEGIRKVSATITDLSGKVLGQIDLRAGSQELDVSGLPNGVYLLYLDGIGAKRFVVEK